MQTIIDRIRREPALVTGAISALIALAAAFGLDLSGEQTGAVMAVTTALLAFVTRSQVTPTAAVAAKEPEPGAPLEAGPAADVETGDAVDVVPVLDVPHSSDPKADATYHDAD